MQSIVTLPSRISIRLRLRKFLTACVLILITASCSANVPVKSNDALHLDVAEYSQAEIEEDFESFLAFIKTTHPNLEYSTDLDHLEAVAQIVRDSLHDGMSVRDAWMAMAILNPVFADAHVGVRRPVDALAAYEKDGRVLFPIPVMIDAADTLRVDTGVSEGLGVSAGDQILSINGIAAQEILDRLEPRMRGRSKALRQMIMGLYFPQYFWTAFGGYERYVVRIKNQQSVQDIELSSTTKSASDEPKAQFSYKKLNEAAGYLEITTFDIEQKDRFAAFLEDAFAQIQNDELNTLIIDIRKNTGGAHDLSDLLLAYLTPKPYSAISGVTARITEDNINRIPGATLGAVVSIPFQQLIEPPADYPMRFKGNVYVLIGGLTYSQSIVFASTAQDYQIAKIAGQETEGAANQSGQVQLFTMPNTGLQGLVPIYIFKRASGDTSRRGVIPDIIIEDDSLRPMASVDKLLETLRQP